MDLSLSLSMKAVGRKAAAGANELVDTEVPPNILVDTEPTPNELTDTE